MQGATWRERLEGGGDYGDREKRQDKGNDSDDTVITTTIIISYGTAGKHVKHLLATRPSSETFCELARVILTAAR